MIEWLWQIIISLGGFVKLGEVQASYSSTAWLVEINWEILPVPQEEESQKYASFIHSKDLHVLAAAVEGGSEFLLTLDRKHILAAAEAVQKARLPIHILRPGDFIQQYYSLHEEYYSLLSRRGGDR